jgi:hypothetical protein
MFSMPPAIFRELTSVANETGLTVDNIIQEAVLNWIRSEAPAHMRNVEVVKDFSSRRSLFKVIEGRQTRPGGPPRDRALTRRHVWE